MKVYDFVPDGSPFVFFRAHIPVNFLIIITIEYLKQKRTITN